MGRTEPLLANGSLGSMGGMLTPLSDLGRYVGAFLAAWPPRDGAETGPITRSSLREMQQVWRPASAVVTKASPSSAGFGGGGLQLSSGGHGLPLGLSQTPPLPPGGAHRGGPPGVGRQRGWRP